MTKASLDNLCDEYDEIGILKETNFDKNEEQTNVVVKASLDNLCEDYDYNSDIEIAFDDMYECDIQCDGCSQIITEGVVTFEPSQKDRFGDVMASYLDCNAIYSAIDLENVFEYGTTFCNECLENKK